MRIGLDIGGTTTKGVLVDPNLRVVAERRAPTAFGAEGVAATAEAMIRGLVGDAALALDDVRGIGIGVPGVVDPQTGAVRNAVNLGIVEQALPLADVLAARVGVPVVVDNDLNIAALGAAHLYEAPDLAFIALGTGMAAGFVLNGELWRGAGSAGEVGHIPFDRAGPLCKCGQRGCLELYASGSALAGLWPATADLVGPQALVAAAAAGDPAASAALEGYFDAIAHAVQIVALTASPARIVIGGGVAKMGPPLRDGVRAALNRLAAPSPFLQSLGLPARVTIADPEVEIAALGAALLAAGN